MKRWLDETLLREFAVSLLGDLFEDVDEAAIARVLAAFNTVQDATARVALKRAAYRIDVGPSGALTKTAQTRLVGNSVSPPVAQAIVAANFEREVAVRRSA